MTDSDGVEEIEKYLSQTPVLQRVIEVNRTVEAEGGGRVVIISLEVWSSLLAVQYAVVGSDALNPAGEPRPYDYGRILRDDLGNVYPFVSGGGAGGGDAGMPFTQSTVTCRGPVNAGASRLIYRPQHAKAEDCEIEIDLT